jgi:hypothetical protein
MHFSIYPISDQYSFHDANAPYAIAFGQSALLLDTLAYTLRAKEERYGSLEVSIPDRDSGISTEE